MLAKLENPSLIVKAIELVSELATEVRIKVNEEGLGITAMDPANAAMVGFKVPKDVFSEFEAGDEILGVNLDNLKRILKRAGTGNLIIERKGEDNFLKIEIQDRIKRNFSLGLIDVDSEEKELPSLEFGSKVVLNSSDFIDCIDDCLVVDDACSFATEEGKFVIEAKGVNSSRSEFSGDEAEIEAENCRSRYSLEYLQKFAKASKLSDKTFLFFSDDYPLKMEIKTEKMQMTFVLAPRSENDDR